MGRQNGARPTASEVGAVPPPETKTNELPGETVGELPATDAQESRPMSMVTGMVNETMKQAGEREDVKSVLSTMNVLYTQNLEKRVEDLKVTLNPHVEKIDNLACGGIDKINEKLAETKEVYVAPVVDKLNGTKEVYVDPVITKAMDFKEKTTKVVASASETIAGAKTVYIDPAMRTAEDIKESYVEPAVKMTQDYIAPVMVQAYNDPATAYGDMVKLGKEVATITKIGATGYSLYENLWNVPEKLATTSVTMATENRDYALKLLHEHYPEHAEALDQNIKHIAETAQALYDGSKTAAEFTVEASKVVYASAKKSYAIAKISVITSKDFLTDVTDRLVEYTNRLLSTHENNIRYVARVFRMSSFIGLLGYSKEE